LALEPDPTVYATTTHLHHSEASSVERLRRGSTIARAAMERSEFWDDAKPNVLYDTPTQRIEDEREREVNAAHLDRLTVQRIQHSTPIEAENGCAGPKWGSTATRATFTEKQTPAERLWQIDRDLIGPRDPTAFARQPVTVHEEAIAPQISTTQASYPRHPIGRPIQIPNRTAMEGSGFSKALTRENAPQTVDPYVTIQQLSYQNPSDGLSPIERALSPGTRIRRGPTGYGVNRTMAVGPPGDPRKCEIGASTTKTHYRHPDDVRGPPSEQVSNLVEHSGYWTVAETSVS
jgi:hypothetical protein